MKAIYLLKDHGVYGKVLINEYLLVRTRFGIFKGYHIHNTVDLFSSYYFRCLVYDSQTGVEIKGRLAVKILKMRNSLYYKHKNENKVKELDTIFDDLHLNGIYIPAKYSFGRLV